MLAPLRLTLTSPGFGTIAGAVSELTSSTLFSEIPHFFLLFEADLDQSGNMGLTDAMGALKMWGSLSEPTPTWVLPQHQVGTTIPYQGIFLGLSKLKFYARKIFFSHAIVGSNAPKTARNF